MNKIKLSLLQRGCLFTIITVSSFIGNLGAGIIEQRIEEKRENDRLDEEIKELTKELDARMEPNKYQKRRI